MATTLDLLLFGPGIEGLGLQEVSVDEQETASGS